MPKFCKDCKHLDWFTHSCNRPIDVGPDLVNGLDIPFTAGLDARFERTGSKYLLPLIGKEIELCGLDAKFFDPQPEGWQPPELPTTPDAPSPNPPGETAADILKI
jgi:hypothetical protein